VNPVASRGEEAKEPRELSIASVRANVPGE
jgi:hypothetical protein